VQQAHSRFVNTIAHLIARINKKMIFFALFATSVNFYSKPPKPGAFFIENSQVTPVRSTSYAVCRWKTPP
jgi:hypothetical protein